MNSRQATNTHGNGVRRKLRHHPLIPSQYKGDGPWVRGKRGYGLVLGRKGKPILEFPFKLFWRKCPVGMTYHPKEGR